MTSWTRGAAFGAAVVAATLMGGCGDDDAGTDSGMADSGRDDGGQRDSGTDAGRDSGPGGEDAGTDAGPPGQPRVRAIHLASDVDGVDVFANDGMDPLFMNATFPGATGYEEVASGSYDIDVAPTGMTAAETVLAVDGVMLAEGTDTSVVVIGEAGGVDDTALSALALTDDQTAPAMDMIRVRIIHAASALGEVDVWDVTSPAAPAPILSDVPYAGTDATMAVSDYLELPAEALSVGVDVDDDADPEAVFDLPALPAGTIANVFAVTDDTDAPFLFVVPSMGEAVRIDPRGERGFVRVLHLSPDTGGVDVFVDDGAAAAVTNLEFESGTDYIPLAPGTYDFDVAPTGMDAAASVLPIDDFAVVAGEFTTFVAVGESMTTPPTLQGLAITDAYDVPVDQVRVRFTHAAPGVGEVDIIDESTPGDPQGIAPWADAAFPTVGAAADLPAAPPVGVDTDNDGLSNLAFNTPSLPAGTLVNVYAVNMGTDVFVIAQLPDGSTVRVDPRGPQAFLRVLHLSPDTGAVDVFVNDGMIAAVSNLSFGENTEYIALDPATYDFDVSPTGMTAMETALPIDDVMLAADTFYTVAAIGLITAGMTPALQAQLQVDDIDFARVAGQVQFQVIHGSAATGAVTLFRYAGPISPAIPFTGVMGAPLAFSESFSDTELVFTPTTPPTGISLDVDGMGDQDDVSFLTPTYDPGTGTTRERGRNVVSFYVANDPMGNVFAYFLPRSGSGQRLDPI